MSDSAPRLRAVAFDLDGLMANTEDLFPLVGDQLLGRRHKVFTPDLLDAMMGLPSHVSLQVMIDWHDLDDSIDDLRREVAELFPQILEEHLQPMPGLLSLLAALETAGIPKAIVTSSGHDYVAMILGLLDMIGRFDFVITAEDVTHGKPDPEIYLKAAERFGVSPAEMMVLEDSQNGCRAGVLAGAFTVAVPGDHSRMHDFTGARLTADTLCDDRIYQALGLPRPE